MKILFLLAFGGGLATAVYAMLHGVERSRSAGVTRPAPYMNLPALAAFMVTFGAIGYLLMRRSNLSTPSVALFALVGGAIGWFAMSLLMAKWALRVTEPNAHDAAEEVQGQLAVVMTAITEGSPGSIRYGHPVQIAQAKSIDGSPMGVGTEVVIDRFDNDLAIVESWASVEQRL
ncbi:MAG: hypothetical protein H0U64_01750 [Gemmatimonadaceae bacterium]|nr:hypothetical protein [Gemmatimonadaceae bacterium]